jgi:hypothetical protein
VRENKDAKYIATGDLEFLKQQAKKLNNQRSE